MILFLFSIFNMKTLFSTVSPPTFHLAPRSLSKKCSLVQKIDHLSVGVSLPVCLRKTKLCVSLLNTVGLSGPIDCLKIRSTMCANLMFEIVDKSQIVLVALLALFGLKEPSLKADSVQSLNLHLHGGKRRRFNFKETCTNFVSFNGFLRNTFRPLQLFLLSDHFPNLLSLFVLEWQFFPLILGKNQTSWQ